MLDMHGRESEPARKDSPAGTVGSSTPPAGRVLMRRETAHRGGKTVIVLEGFSAAWSTARLQDLLHDIKTALGCGGKTAGQKIEIQGEQSERLQPLLEARGFAVKRGW